MCNDIEKRVINVIVKQLGVSKDKVLLTSSFVKDLGADSLDIVELIMTLEEEFKTDIPDDDAEKIVTVSDVVIYIKNNVLSHKK